MLSSSDNLDADSKARRIGDIYANMHELRLINDMLNAYQLRITNKSAKDIHHISCAQDIKREFDQFIQSLAAEWPDPTTKKKPSFFNWKVIGNAYQQFLILLYSDNLFNADIKVSIEKNATETSYSKMILEIRKKMSNFSIRINQALVDVVEEEMTPAQASAIKAELERKTKALKDMEALIVTSNENETKLRVTIEQLKEMILATRVQLHQFKEMKEHAEDTTKLAQSRAFELNRILVEDTGRQKNKIDELQNENSSIKNELILKTNEAKLKENEVTSLMKELEAAGEQAEKSRSEYETKFQELLDKHEEQLKVKELETMMEVQKGWAATARELEQAEGKIKNLLAENAELKHQLAEEIEDLVRDTIGNELKKKSKLEEKAIISEKEIRQLKDLLSEEKEAHKVFSNATSALLKKINCPIKIPLVEPENPERLTAVVIGTVKTDFDQAKTFERNVGLFKADKHRLRTRTVDVKPAPKSDPAPKPDMNSKKSSSSSSGSSSSASTSDNESEKSLGSPTSTPPQLKKK